MSTHFIPTERSPWAVIVWLPVLKRWDFWQCFKTRGEARAWTRQRKADNARVGFIQKLRVVRAWIPTR